MKAHLLNISKCIYHFLLSLILFSTLLTEVSVNLYLVIYATILLMSLTMLNNKVNAKVLLHLILLGTSITAGYAAAKLLLGNIGITELLHGGLCTSIHNSNISVTAIIIVAIEYMYICGQQMVSRKDSRKKEAVIGISKSDAYESDLFSVRKDDLERFSKYIESFDTIGVLGDWGSGKTYLVDEYIKRHKGEYELIKIETLTCNLDSIDSYLFQQFENVLWRNRIYPKYSRQIQNLMNDDGIFKQLKPIAMKGTISNVTAFHGFCSDIQKLDKQILLVCEDIDRISENDVGQIAKILDLCAKLAGKNVKVIYEYDQKKMTELGFGMEYMEKYIPYMMNLTNISFREMVCKALSEETARNGNLSEEDFEFLSLPIHADPFLSKELGLDFSLIIHLDRITPRKVKIFVEEVNLAMGNEEFAAKDNRKTIIAFYYLKIFMGQLFEQLPFYDNLQDEIKFERRIKDQSTVKSSYFSIMELINLLKNKSIEPGEIRLMFSSKENEAEEEYVIWNRNKLALLHLLGFDYKYLQRYYEYSHTSTKTKKDNPILAEDTIDIKCIEHNEKINSLVKNLYMNGKSEYTDNESNAIVFIDEVLLAPKEEQEEKWNEYLDRCFHSKIYKDNQTVFLFGGDSWLSLAKALRTIGSLPKYRDNCEEIKERFLDFWMSHSEDKQLLLETVKTFTLIEPKEQTSFIKAITCFNSFAIAGNMNTEKAYIEFLETYIGIACRIGYLSGRYCYNIGFEMYRETDNETGSELKGALDRVLEELKNTMEEKSFPASAQKEFEELKLFIQKNIDIVNEPEKVRHKKWEVRTTVSEKINYQNESVYLNLEESAKHKVKNFKEQLNKEYDEGNISLREYRILHEKYLIACDV